MTLNITELGERTGLRSSALRFYERKGLLRPLGREAGKRIYKDDSVEQIALIDLLKTSGFTLAEIAEMADPDGRIAPDWRDRAQLKHDELGHLLRQIEEARSMLGHFIECPEPSLDDCPIHRAIVAEHARRLARR